MAKLIKEADVRIRIDETNALMNSGARDQWARNNAQELKVSHQPLGVFSAEHPYDHTQARILWTNAYHMYRSELEHGVPTPGRFEG